MITTEVNIKNATFALQESLNLMFKLLNLIPKRN